MLCFETLFFIKKIVICNYSWLDPKNLLSYETITYTLLLPIHYAIESYLANLFLFYTCKIISK